MPPANGQIVLKIDRCFAVGWPGSCVTSSAGRGHGTGGERCHGERLDDGIGDGGPADGEQSRWGGQAGGVHAALVPLHQITAAADAGGLHLQRVRAAYDQGHQSSCLHWWNCVCSGMNYVISDMSPSWADPCPALVKCIEVSIAASVVPCWFILSLVKFVACGLGRLLNVGKKWPIQWIISTVSPLVICSSSKPGSSTVQICRAWLS